MDHIVVYVIRLKPALLLSENPLKVLRLPALAKRQFRCKENLFAVSFGKEFSKSRFASRIEIGSIKVIYPVCKGKAHLLLGFLLVHRNTRGSRKPHTSIP